MNTHTVASLAGYTLLDTIYKGSRTEVYRGLQTESQQPVVIKVLRHQHPSFGELVQFRNQYAIARHLNHPAIVCPLALERCGNGYALVMPDEGFISLGTYAQQQPLDLSTVLAIAIQLADALHYLISQRVIHKDIKPANILIHPETRQIQLIDFSIASLLPKEQQQLINPNVLEGTLAYISPEQTGRMNRGIDYRTDFYSLGVTVFELLTGELPFATNDPMELVHSHIAKIPTFPHTLHPTPHTLVEIVLKLMAKNAEDRYQSALGLKYDLERCLHQWKATGEIIPFELGERDMSDRFLIPERLYGREKEVQTLLDTFNRVAGGNTEMMLVAGFSGIGKTAVVNEVHKPITRQKGYFIQGKFDQFNRNIPFSAFVQAFRSLMGQLLSETDTQLQQWKSRILDAVGDNGQVIIEVIPELENIIGQQPPVPELSGSASQNRFNLLFGKLIQVFTTKEHPLVIFLDDLQWADSASLNLIELLMSQASNSYLLMMGAYRDNEVFPAHPLMLTLDEIAKAEATINTITLSPLSQNHINCLVSDTLNCTPEVAQPLTELVYQKTKGNPFFSTQFLLGLYGEGLIQFNREVGHWQCDIAEVRQRALTDDVVEFMAGRLQKLPEETQQVLKLAACIGNQFDLATLAIVSEQSQTETSNALWNALQSGFILPQSEVYKFYLSQEQQLNQGEIADVINYKFLHDRIQQAAYSLIDEKLKAEMHLKIGRLLLSNLSASAIKETIFDLTNQLNRGHSLIYDRHEKDELAHLNLIAGRKAKSSTAYLASIDYLNLGIQLLEDGWNRQYDLMLSLYLEAIESEYISTQFENSKALADLALNQVNCLLDRLKIHELQIQYYIAKGQRKQAVDLGIDALKLLNIELDCIAPEVTNIEALADLPEMTDPFQIVALQLLIATVSAAVIAAPDLLVPIAFKLVNICIRSGNSKLSPYAYGFYAWMLCSSLGKIDAGYRFGKLAIQLVDRFNAKTIKCKVYQQFNTFVRHYKEPLQNISISIEAIQSGLEMGDIEYACYAAQDYSISRFFIDPDLNICLEEQKKYLELIRQKKQEFSFNFTSPWLQLVSNLLNGSFVRAIAPTSLEGDFYNETERITALKQINDHISLFPIFFIKLYLSYLFSDYKTAIENGIEAEKFKTGSRGFIYYPVYLFYHSLALLMEYSSANFGERKTIVDRVNSFQKQLGCWMKDAPFTYQHKYDLVEAERHRVLGEKMEALELYDRAIAGAKENKYLQEEALANELAAKFYLDWGKEKIAATYMQEAYYCYARWGAKAKTDHLEANYSQLLRPILQKTSSTLHPFETLASISSLKSTLCSTTTGIQTSESNANAALDLVTLFKASQAISSTINLDELLTQLTQILLHNSGGDRCAIILCEPNQEMKVRAIRLSPRYANATVDATDLSSVTLKDATHLPVKLIHYVKNSGETVVMDSPECNIPIVDHDLTQRQPASVLCLPLVDRSQLRGILYLENQATSGVFHPQRLAALQLLATQAAIALENARLYQQAQDYAQQLEESQLQLVQSEKMSALGNLVAGVAHEINNPLGFINGNITEVRHSLDDLTECLQSYRQTFPEPGDEIEALLEELEVDFLLEDLPNMLDSMKVGCDRIRGISTSLRMFSRADTESKFKANVHDGIESTLLILKYRLKAKDFRPEIEVIRDYGNLPEINCFPGQLNQVFMNLLANAIDMFDEIAEGRSFDQLQANPQRIIIQTQVVEPHSIDIRIGDNGKGMSEEVCSKIFDRKFTTKAVGKGTGLGLAIARQVIVEKHGGSLEVQSQIAQGTEFFIRLPI